MTLFGVSFASPSAPARRKRTASSRLAALSVAASRSRQVRIAAPSTVSTRSPCWRPASAAGEAGSTHAISGAASCQAGTCTPTMNATATKMTANTMLAAGPATEISARCQRGSSGVSTASAPTTSDSSGPSPWIRT